MAQTKAQQCLHCLAVVLTCAALSIGGAQQQWQQQQQRCLLHPDQQNDMLCVYCVVQRKVRE
jgi:hypothetical protein